MNQETISLRRGRDAAGCLRWPHGVAGRKSPVRHAVRWPIPQGNREPHPELREILEE
jgi:hypothetical protein